MLKYRKLFLMVTCSMLIEKSMHSKFGMALSVRFLPCKHKNLNQAQNPCRTARQSEQARETETETKTMISMAHWSITLT